MSIKTKFTIAFSLILVPIIVTGLFVLNGLKTFQRVVVTEMTPQINALDTNAHLNSLAQFIRYYDEVLTQSARNYAFTADSKWKSRYEAAVPELDANIQEAIRLGDKEDEQIFSSVDESNRALIAMEEQSMQLVVQGEQTEAIGILEGAEYAKQKEIYQNALIAYSKKQGKQYDETFAVSTNRLRDVTKTIADSIQTASFWIVLIIIIVIGIGAGLWLFLFSLIFKPLLQFNQVAKEITEGNLNKKLTIISKDEIGALASSFNTMVDAVRQTRMSIEEKVKQRTEQLEKLNKIMVGREMKMIELKKELEELRV